MTVIEMAMANFKACNPNVGEVTFRESFPSQSFGRDIKQVFRWNLPKGGFVSSFFDGRLCWPETDAELIA